MTEFPKIYPNWVGNYKPPTKANAQQDFQDKSRTVIRLSNIATAGEFSAFYERLTIAQAEKIWAFFAQVETVDTFTLPKKFIRHTDKILVSRYLAISPTGLYRMEEPQETRLNNCLIGLEVRFSGEIA